MNDRLVNFVKLSKESEYVWSSLLYFDVQLDLLLLYNHFAILKCFYRGGDALDLLLILGFVVMPIKLVGTRITNRNG